MRLLNELGSFVKVWSCYWSQIASWRIPQSTMFHNFAFDDLDECRNDLTLRGPPMLPLRLARSGSGLGRPHSVVRIVTHSVSGDCWDVNGMAPSMEETEQDNYACCICF